MRKLLLVLLFLLVGCEGKRDYATEAEARANSPVALRDYRELELRFESVKGDVEVLKKLLQLDRGVDVYRTSCFEKNFDRNCVTSYEYRPASVVIDGFRYYEKAVTEKQDTKVKRVVKEPAKK